MNDLAGLIAFARFRPEGLTFATSGTGTLLHLWGDMFARREPGRMKHVPYRIAAQIPNDRIAVLTIATTVPLLRQGRIREFANSSLNPLPRLPLLGGFEMLAWRGLFAVARTDPALIPRLAPELVAMHADAPCRGPSWRVPRR